MKTFTFQNVLLIKPYVFALIGAFIIAPIILGIIFLINTSLPVLIGATAIGFVIMFAIFKRMSKTVEINFDADHINFTYDGKTTSYLKSDLKGFYSFNHFRDAVSTISMCFEFNNGKKIDISDYLGAGKFVPEKNDMLKQFLTTAEAELGFTDVSVDKKRKLGKLGSTWFSRGQSQTGFLRA
jgi:hypothetical protein